MEGIQQDPSVQSTCLANLNKEGSNIAMVVWGCPILLKIKILFKVFTNAWHNRLSQQVQINRTSHSSIKKSGPINPLDDKQHYILIPGELT